MEIIVLLISLLLIFAGIIGIIAPILPSTILVFFLIAITGFLSIIIFPFLGAVLGELIIGKTRREALSAGLGTLIGFIFGTVFKIVISFAMTGYFIYNLIASY